MVHLWPWRPGRRRVGAVLEATPRGAFTHAPFVGATRGGGAGGRGAGGEAAAPASAAEAPWPAAPGPLRASLRRGRYGRDFRTDCNACVVGRGREDFAAAREALLGWEHFQLGWTQVDKATGTEPGSKVAVVARAVLPWTINPLEVVWLDDSGAPGRRAKGGRTAFAHGTTRGHLLSGEERFAVEWDGGEVGEVRYEVAAFSRPGHPLAAATYPVVRLLQRRFAQDSMKALQGVVEQKRRERAPKS